MTCKLEAMNPIWLGKQDNEYGLWKGYKDPNHPKLVVTYMLSTSAPDRSGAPPV
jgi:hypothetical protein